MPNCIDGHKGSSKVKIQNTYRVIQKVNNRVISKSNYVELNPDTEIIFDI